MDVPCTAIPARRLRPMGWALAGVAGLALAAGSALGAGHDQEPERPPSARRLVRQFTFDEPDNPDPVPAHWRRAQDDPTPGGARRSGFPAFNRAAFDAERAFSGSSSVRLPTQGGSTALRLQGGEVPVFPDADYAVAAKVRTAGLEHARAFVTVRLLDQRLEPIPGTQVRSEPVLSEEGWADVRAVLRVRDDRAAWMQVDLELLQPRQFEPEPGGPAALHRVWREDVSGEAWFDDVTIGLLPRIEFGTARPGGVHAAGAVPGPELRVVARDQGGEPLEGTLRVRDIDGRVLAERSLTVDPSGRPESFAPALPGAGWYRATLDISAEGRPIWRGEQWLVVLPAGADPSREADALAAEDRRRFGVIADTLPEAFLPGVATLIDGAGVRFVVVPAVDPLAPPEAGRETLARRAPALERLLGAGRELTLALAAVPRSQASALYLDPADTLGWVARPGASWMAYLEPTLDVYGQRIVRYQLGRVGAAAPTAELAPGLAAFRSAVVGLVPDAHLSVPWRADVAFPAMRVGGRGAPDSPDALAMLVPAGFSPAAMGTLARSWREGGGGELTLAPELLAPGVYGQRARLNDFVRRAVEFWNAFADGAPAGVAPARLGVLDPWAVGGDDAGARLMPGPELAALSALSGRLSGRRVVGEVPAPAGVRALLLARRVEGGRADARTLAGACVIAWNESADEAHAYVEAMPMERGLRPEDVFGNGTPIDAAPGVLTRVRVGDAPVFIEHVDPYMSLFVGSLRLSPPFVPAVVEAHEHRVEFTNPWPVRISGQVQVKEAEPEGAAGPRLRAEAWSISPNVIPFALAPGERASLPVTLSFGPGQLAGTKELAIVAKVLADRSYAPVKMSTSVEIGLPELELLPDVRLTPGPAGPDVLITAAVTNHDARARTLRVEVAAKDLPNQQAAVSDLPPGQTVLKRFVFRDGARALRGRPVRVTLADDESAARLSKAVFVP